MDRILFVFGILVLLFSFIFLVMNFIGEYDGTDMIIAIFAMLNASIAIGVSEILSRTKNLK